MCAPRSGGIKPQSISSNIEKLVVILTSVGLMRACLVLQLGWMLVVVVGKGDGGGGGVCDLGVAASEGELAEEVVRLRGRVFAQFGACRCVWCDDALRCHSSVYA